MTETLLDPQVEESEETLEQEPPRRFPFELSALIKNVVGNQIVTAINAGDGSLLAAFDPIYRFGLDSKEKNRAAENCTYNKVYGPYGETLPLLTEIGGEAEHVIVDLTEVEDWKQSIDLAHRLQFESNYREEDGTGYSRPIATVFVTKREDADRLLKLPLVEDEVFARVSIELGEEQSLAITFCSTLMKPLEEGKELPSRGATPDTLDLLGPWVMEQTQDRYSAFGNFKWQVVSPTYTDGRKNLFAAAHKEYGRRFIKSDREFDLMLVGGNQIHVQPSSWVSRCLQARGVNDVIVRVRDKMVQTFGQNPGEWLSIRELIDEGIVIADPRLVLAAEAVVRQSLKTTTPLERPSPAQCIGWLVRKNRIQCIKDYQTFKAGQWYSIRVREEKDWDYFEMQQSDRETGEIVTVKKRDEIKFLRITIGGQGTVFFRDDDPEHIFDLLEHFDVGMPGDLATEYPEAVEPMLEIVERINRETVAPNLRLLTKDEKASLKNFQLGGIARILAVDNGILAWEQGLGKTVGGLTFIAGSFEKGAQECALIIAPKDLIDQWQREAKRLFGWDLHRIGGDLEARHRESERHLPRNKKTQKTKQDLYRDELARVHALAKRLADPKEKGLFITSFWDLAQFGKMLNQKTDSHTVGSYEKSEWIPTQYVEDTEKPIGSPERYRKVEGHYKTTEVEMLSDDFCPACTARMQRLGDGRIGADDIHSLRWNGVFCTRRVQHHSDNPHRTKSRLRKRTAKGKPCGYSIFEKKAPSISRLLSSAFKRGVVVVDEGTEISGDTQQSLAVRGLSGRYRLLMTGTPIRNFVGQAFYLLWWALKGRESNLRFPYSMHSKAEFERTFSVVRQKLHKGKWVREGKAGQITNISRFWRLASSSILRQRKEDTGEPIVKLKRHKMRAPFGLYQREQLQFLAENYADYFAEKFPDDPKVKTGAHKRMTHILGLDQAWDWAACVPASWHSAEWSGIPVSNWTPMTFKTLETTLRLVAMGRKVIVGTSFILAAEFLKEALETKGINVASTVRGGATLNPDKRAVEITNFQEGDAQVLVATIKSIRLGHNLDAASAVVCHGLEWQYEQFFQFEARAHRLTSKRPVDVFVVLPGEVDQTIPGRKWMSLEDKAKGIGKAIDGAVIEREEDTIDKAKIVREMLEKGIPKTGNEIPEENIKAAFQQLPHWKDIEVPDSFKDTLAKPDEFEEILPSPKAYVTPLLTHGNIADSLEVFFKGAIELAKKPKIVAVIQYDEPIGPEWLEPEDVEATERELTLIVNDLMGDLEQDLQEVLAEPEEEPETEPESIDLAPAPPTVTTSDLIQNLKELKELADLGVLDDTEFAEMKAAILAQMKALTTATIGTEVAA